MVQPAMAEDWKTIRTSEQMNALLQAWKLTNRCIKWWGIFLACLLFIAAVAMMFGALTLEVNLDLVIVDNLTNPMVALTSLSPRPCLLLLIQSFLLSLCQ